MDEIETIDFTEKEVKEEIKSKPLPIIQEPKEIPKEIKKQEIKSFNENPDTKKFGVKLYFKKHIISLYIIIFILLLLLSVNMIWHNSILERFSNKDFSPINNITTNVTAEFTEGADNNNITNNVYNNYTIMNNFTILNNNTILISNETI
jgi:hypothetical protein